MNEFYSLSHVSDLMMKASFIVTLNLFSVNRDFVLVRLLNRFIAGFLEYYLVLIRDLSPLLRNIYKFLEKESCLYPVIE